MALSDIVILLQERIIQSRNRSLDGFDKLERFYGNGLEDALKIILDDVSSDTLPIRKDKV